MTTIRDIIKDAMIESQKLQKRIIEEDGFEDDYQAEAEAEAIIDEAIDVIKGRIVG